MANISKKDGGQNQPQASQPQQQQAGQRGELVRERPQALTRDPFQWLMRDPFELMREMMVNPFRMFQMMPSMMPSMRAEMAWNPSFDVRETDDAFVFKADIPGVKNEDIDVSLTGNRLQISGKREHEKEEEEGQIYSYERSYGSFCRSFTLPESADTDNVRCDLENGVLTLVVPKKPGTSPQLRKIQVGSGEKH